MASRCRQSTKFRNWRDVKYRSENEVLSIWTSKSKRAYKRTFCRWDPRCVCANTGRLWKSLEKHSRTQTQSTIKYRNKVLTSHLWPQVCAYKWAWVFVTGESVSLNFSLRLYEMRSDRGRNKVRVVLCRAPFWDDKASGSQQVSGHCGGGGGRGGKNKPSPPDEF